MQPSVAPSTGNGVEPQPVVVHVPVDVRSVSIGVLAALACVFTLKWASAVFIPVMFGLMLSYALSPIVNRLHRWRVPRAVAAAVLLLGLVAGTGTLVYSLRDDAVSLIELLPEVSQKLRLKLQQPRHQAPGTFDNVQKAAAELERVAEGAAPDAPKPQGVTRVVVEKPPFTITSYLWTGTLGLIGLVGQFFIVLLIGFFLLATGDSFRRKMMRLAGPRISEKRVTLEALRDINEQIQRYLLVQLATSALVGVVTWLVFAWIGLEHADVWGLVAAVTNLIPYLGAVAVGLGSAVFALMQFERVDMALSIGGASFIIHGLIGHVLTPWLTSRAGRMNPVAVFIGVLAWGWLWGLPGLILGIPILMVVKALCDRVHGLKLIGELLGE